MKIAARWADAHGEEGKHDKLHFYLGFGFFWKHSAGGGTTCKTRQFLQINPTFKDSSNIMIKRTLLDRFLFCLSDQFGSSFTQELRIKVWAALLWCLGNPSEWLPPGMVLGWASWILVIYLSMLTPWMARKHRYIRECHLFATRLL